MKIKESIQRLGWRFRESAKNRKPFTVNQNDVEAINTLIEFYEKTTAANYNTNELCFKMYVWHRVEMMKHYKADIFDTIPQKVLTEHLCKPVDAFLNRFTAYLNEKEYVALANETDGAKPFFLLNEVEKKDSVKKLEAMLKDNPELFKTLSGDVWSKEQVKDNLIAEFNQLLQIAG